MAMVIGARKLYAGYHGSQSVLENEMHDFNATVSSAPAKYRRAMVTDDVSRVRGRGRATLAGRQELKYFDTSLVDVPNTVSLINTLNPVPRGTTLTNRIGRKIYIRSLHVFYTITLQSTAVLADMANEVRILIVVDKQTNGAAAVIADVLETATTRSFHNLDHSSRFDYIWDKRFALTTVASGGTNSHESTQCGKIFKKFKRPIVVEFEEPGTGVLSTITTHNLLCFLVSTRGNAEVDIKFRIRYTDGY